MDELLIVVNTANENLQMPVLVEWKKLSLFPMNLESGAFERLVPPLLWSITSGWRGAAGRKAMNRDGKNE